MRLKEIKPEMVTCCKTVDEYNRGLNAGWELAKKICLVPENGGLNAEEILEILDSCSADGILMNFTPQEVLAKIEAYEKKNKPKTEWIDVCIILGGYGNEAVHEEILNSEYGSTKEEQAQEILKKYISEHEDNYIAIIERVCRVKE